MAPEPGSREAIEQLANAKRNSSDVQLTGIGIATRAEGEQLTWNFTGNPKLAQTTFGLRKNHQAIIVKFDGDTLTSMSLFDHSTNTNTAITLDYTYADDHFTLDVPHHLVDLDSHRGLELDITVNGIVRGTVNANALGGR